MKALVALDIERLENTSFAAVFGEGPVGAGPTDAADLNTLGCGVSEHCASLVSCETTIHPEVCRITNVVDLLGGEGQ